MVGQNYGSKVRVAKRKYAKVQKKSANEVKLQQMYIDTFSTFDNYAKGIGSPATTGRHVPGAPRGGWTLRDKAVKEWEKPRWQSYDTFTFYRPEDIVKSQGGAHSISSPTNFRIDKFITYTATKQRKSTSTYRSIADQYREKAISAEFGKLSSAQAGYTSASKPFDSSWIKSARGNKGGTVIKDDDGNVTGVVANTSKPRNEAGFFISDGGTTGLSATNQTNYNLLGNYSNTNYTAAGAYGEARGASSKEEKAQMDMDWQSGIRESYAAKFGIDLNQSYGSDKTETVAERKAAEAAKAENTFEELYGSFAKVTPTNEKRVMSDAWYTMRGLDIPKITASKASEEKRIKAEQDKNNFDINNTINSGVYTSQQQGTNAEQFNNKLIAFDEDGRISSAPASGVMNMGMFDNVSPEKQKEISSYLIDVMVDERIDLDKKQIDTDISKIESEMSQQNYQLSIEKLMQQNRDIYGAETAQKIVAYGDDKNKQKGSEIMSDHRMQGLPTLEENGVAYDPVAFTMTNQVIGNEKLDFEGTENQYFINSNSPTPAKSYVSIGGVIDGKVSTTTLYNTRSEYNKANPDNKLTRDQWGAMDSKLSQSEQKKYDKEMEARRAAENYGSLTTGYKDIYGEEYVSSSSHPNAINELDGFANTVRESSGDFGVNYTSQSDASRDRIGSIKDAREESERKKNKLLKDKKTIEDALSSVGRNDYINKLYDSGGYNAYNSGALLTVTKDPGRDRMINQIELYASEQKQTKSSIRRVDKLQAELNQLRRDKNKANSNKYSNLVLSQQKKLKNERASLKQQLGNMNDSGSDKAKTLSNQITLKDDAIKELKTQTNWQVRKDNLYEKITSFIPTMPTAFADTGMDNATLGDMGKKLNQTARAIKSEQVVLKDAKNALALRLAKASTTEENIDRANITNQTQQSKDEFERLSGLDVSELEEDGYTTKQITQLAFNKMDESGFDSSGVLNKTGARNRAGGIDVGEGGWYDTWLNKGGSSLMRNPDDINLVLGGKTPDQNVKNEVLGKKAILEKYDAWGEASSRIGGALGAWKTELGNFYGSAYGTKNVAESTVSKSWFGTSTVEGESWGTIANREVRGGGLHIGSNKRMTQVIDKSERYRDTLSSEVDVKKQELEVLRQAYAQKESQHQSLRPQIAAKIEMGIKDGNISRDDAFEATLKKSSEELYDLQYSITEHEVAKKYYEESLGKTTLDIEKFKQRKKEIEFELIQGTSSSGMINRIRRSGSWGGQQANRFRRNTGARRKTTRGGYQSLGGLVK